MLSEHRNFNQRLTDIRISGKLKYGRTPLIIKLRVGPAILFWKSTHQIVDYSSGIGRIITTICSVRIDYNGLA
jgi:hypothetical protein